MAGNVRIDSSSTNNEDLAFAANHPNVQRGHHSGASLDRSGSFREGSEGRMFNSNTGPSRGSSTSLGDLPPVSQFLTLEPLTMIDQKYTRSGELRRILGISIGATAEDGAIGNIHVKPPYPAATEELKRFKSSVLDTSVKARSRIKKLDEYLHKVNKYYEALNSKKLQRNESFVNERSGGSTLLKVGSQIHRNAADLTNQRLEDRTKNVSLSKRIRSSVAENRTEGQGNTLMRQPLFLSKDRDIGRDSGEGSDPVEEKIRRLPAGGEGWEKKMKRKRSIGNVFSRPMESDGEMKRVSQKMKTESGLQFSEGLRSGSSSGASGMNKLESSMLPPGTTLRGVSKSEQEKTSLVRDFSPAYSKERVTVKANNKSSIREDTAMQNPVAVTKGKASRTSRSSPIAAGGSPASFSRASGTLEALEQSPNLSKVHLSSGSNNRKRPIPSGSSSPITSWGGQRPPKNCRTRRTNVVSPVSNHDEIPMSADGCTSDLGTKATSVSRSFASGIQQLKVKLENISSPARLSESEESGAGESHESRLKEKRASSIEVDEREIVTVNNINPMGVQFKKQKLNKEDNGDTAQKEGRSGRGSSFSRASGSPLREKLENANAKPLRSVRPASDKNGSKTGRPPLKKLSERKGTGRPGKTPVSSNPDFTGESDDDREELLEAATFVSSASYLACSGDFWKKMESMFSSISSEGISYLEQQVKSSEESHKNLMKKLISSSYDPEEILTPPVCVKEDQHENVQGLCASKDLPGTRSLVDQMADINNIHGSSEIEGMKVLPLYQRLLASLICEDEAAIQDESDGRKLLFQCGADDHHTLLPSNGKSRDSDILEYHRFMSGLQLPNQADLDRAACNGITSHNTCTQNKYDFNRDGQFVHAEKGFCPIIGNGLQGPLVACPNAVESPFDEQYLHMSVEGKLLMELHSIGLYPENVPDLADGDDEGISSEISDLQRKLTQKVGKKKALLDKLVKAVEERGQNNQRDLEQIAMDKLVETAYRKQLATRASYASKHGIPKVPKHVAVAFMKRTLARCRKLEETGKSCFSDSPFNEALSAPPPRCEESTNCNMPLETLHSKPEAGASGYCISKADHQDLPFNNSSRSSLDKHGAPAHLSQTFVDTGLILPKGKKKELLLEDVGGSVSLRMTSSLNNLSGGTKGKRSERDRDRDTAVKHSLVKNSRQAVDNFKGERKKVKPKQRTAQLSTSGNGFSNKYSESTHPQNFSASGSGESFNNTGDAKRERSPICNGNLTADTSKENKESVDLMNLDLHIDSIGDLDVHSWLNFDGDGLQDHYSMGLEIPMDDLSDVFV